MSRPKRCRRICEYPLFWSFQTVGSCLTEDVSLTLDEYETIRLIDYCGLDQEQCAFQMNVSRATIANIYESARFKISDFLVNGKKIRITGGSYMIDSIPASADIAVKEKGTMRIAVTFDNGNVGQHFGQTEKFKVYDINDNAIKTSQVIDTNGAGHCALASFLRAAEVDALICGGIGMGARNAMAEFGIRIIPGVEGNADAVVKEYLEGKLNFNPNETCNHHDHEDGHDCHSGNHNAQCGGCHHH